MKYLILGSGFGLYGYLPAVLSKKNNTVNTYFDNYRSYELEYQKIEGRRKSFDFNIITFLNINS